MGRLAHIKHALFVAAMLLGTFASAQERGPVVVELYTSQGCSSCPPADKLLHELAKREGVIALALHVDYWDYIGWKDVFAQPAFANRQRGYARKAGKSMIYTPQMVIDGETHVVGNKPMDVADALAAHAAKPNAVKVALERSGGRLTIRAEGQVSGTAEIHVVEYQPNETVEITRGENRGKRLTYANIVRSWTKVGTWDGRKALSASAKISGNMPVAVLVQSADHGVVLGSAALR
ncbi:DUF1223 domain-containing protein [Primorskyibacter sp. S187A]|uniref:DUF1223 domain-containing protein n=1 Tax=Primorskyibacter sp. S187A TaxID=3415130 RepID=UPI003C7C0526